MYVDQSIKMKLDQGQPFGRAVSQGYCLSPILFSFGSQHLTDETVEGFGKGEAVPLQA